LGGYDSGAVASAFDSSHNQNAHFKLLNGSLGQFVAGALFGPRGSIPAWDL
jgi:hypothetical protein